MRSRHCSADPGIIPGLECPVCQELKDCEQHQCRHGHVLCAECDERLQRRHCPICRMDLGPLDDAIRCRSQEVPPRPPSALSSQQH